MLPLTRFWSLILVLGAVAGIAIAMIGTRMIDERTDDATRGALVRDRFELEALLKLDARARIDAIAPLAAHNDVRTALRTATGRAAGTQIDETLSTNLRTRLGELNNQLGEMSADVIFAVDQNGIIVTQFGGGATPPLGAGLGAFPLVRRALDGYVRDDVWVYNGEVYRMAARPVVDAGQYVGAIVVGKRFDDVFAQRLVRFLSGASVAFFLRDQVVASAMPSTGEPGISRTELGTPLATIADAPEWAAGELSPVQTVPTGFAVFAPIVGGASYAHVGYAIARPSIHLESPTAIVGLASGEDWAALPWGMLSAFAFVLFVLAMLWIWLEHSRPLTKFRNAAERLGKRDLDRFVPPEFGGQLRTAAASINEALDKVQDAAAATGARRKAADLDQILGKAPETSSPAFFGFGEDKSRSSGGDFELLPVGRFARADAAGAGRADAAGRQARGASRAAGAARRARRQAGRTSRGASGRHARRASGATRQAPGSAGHHDDRRRLGLGVGGWNAPSAVGPAALGSGRRRAARRVSGRGRRGRGHDGGQGPRRAAQARGLRGRRAGSALPRGLRAVRRDEEAVQRADGGPHLRQVRGDAAQEPRADRAEARRRQGPLHGVREGGQGRAEGDAHQGMKRVGRDANRGLGLRSGVLFVRR